MQFKREEKNSFRFFIHLQFVEDFVNINLKLLLPPVEALGKSPFPHRVYRRSFFLPTLLVYKMDWLCSCVFAILPAMIIFIQNFRKDDIRGVFCNYIRFFRREIAQGIDV